MEANPRLRYDDELYQNDAKKKTMTYDDRVYERWRVVRTRAPTTDDQSIDEMRDR